MSQEKELLNVGIKKGTFYISEKEDKGSGWEKQEFNSPSTGEAMVRYHKKINVEGRVNYLAMKEDNYKGMCLSMIVGGDDESYSLTIPIMDGKGSVKTTDNYFNSLVGVLEQIKKGDKVKMFINNKKEDKNGRLYRNVVVLDENDKLIKSDFSFSDVPDWKSTEKEDDFGKKVKTWDASPANKFFIEKFKEVVANFGSGSSNTKQEQPTQKSEPKASKPASKPAPPVDDYDDLPF